MCNFFSINSNGAGKPFYFDKNIRKKILEKELDYNSSHVSIADYTSDSHTSIADYFGFRGKNEDKMNKYEYNPLTKDFRIDILNTVDDSKMIEEFCNNLNFKTVVPELIIKPIVNPFRDIKTDKVTEQDLEHLKTWASVWAFVWDFVWDSVGASVRASVGDSVRASVWASVWDSVGDSVGDSVRAYISSFFTIQFKYDFSSCIKLWERGIVPSYDGKIWRLHSYKGVIWEGKA